MRIVAGQWRGRRLKRPGSIKGLRPTSDRLREALYSILGQRVVDGVFVDLYSGTGAVGLEAASRGARQVALVEKNRPAQELCGENIARCGAEAIVELRRVSAERPGPLPLADVVFADPPYAQSAQTSFDALTNIAIVQNGCWCLELASDASKPKVTLGVAVVLDRVYGGSRLIIYERAKS